MLWKAEVKVNLKPSHSDPEGETTTRSLRELSYPVKKVRISKLYSITIEAHSEAEAKHMAEEMCKRLLANPTKDNYHIKVDESR